jgi:hypothetical protein
MIEREVNDMTDSIDWLTPIEARNLARRLAIQFDVKAKDIYYPDGSVQPDERYKAKLES